MLLSLSPSRNLYFDFALRCELFIGQKELTCHQTSYQTFGLKPEIRGCVCSQRDDAEHSQRHIDENRRECLAKCLLEWSHRSNFSHNNKKQNLFLTKIKFRRTLANKCYETKQGGQTRWPNKSNISSIC